MKRNTNPDFVGIAQLKTKQKWQLDQFEAWAAARKWKSFHESHYDWWMFPVDAPSRLGFAWTVYEGDIAELKHDAVYLLNYLRGAHLLGLAWGWDVEKQTYVANPDRDQRWQQWPIRLYKCARSLQLFGYDEQFNSFRKYAQDLLKKGEPMEFNGKDLSGLFKD
jgi:hypothetical protein